MLEVAFHLILSAIFGGLIAILLYVLFKEQKVDRNPNNVASFFQLDRFVHSGNLRTYARLYGGCVGFALGLAAYSISSSPDLSEALKKVIQSRVISLVGQKSEPLVAGVFDALPSQMIPVVIMSLAIGLFFPYFQKLAEWTREILHLAIGFQSGANRVAEQGASALIQAVGLNKSQDLLEASFGRPAPKPQELLEVSNSTLLEYQFLYYASFAAPAIGLTKAARTVLQRCGVVSAVPFPEPVIVKMSRIIFVVAVYAFSSIVYICLAPLLPVSGGVLWPNPEGYFDLGMEVARFSLGIAGPFFMGLYLFHLRRKREGRAGVAADDFFAIASAQIVFSLFIGVLFAIVVVVRSLYENQSGEILNLFEPKMWVDAVMPIIVSPLLLSVWITMERRRRSNFQIVFVTSIVGGAIYALIEFCYECLTSTVYYFIHEAFLGSVLIALVGLLWTISKLDRITINKVELEF